MKRSVKKWLLRKAKEELEDARVDLRDRRMILSEYERRVTDPSWNLYGRGPDPKRPGEETWGPEVKRCEKYVNEGRAEVAMLEAVVKELEG